MKSFRKTQKTGILLAILVVGLAVCVYFLARYVGSKGTGTTPAAPSAADVGVYIDKGDLWQSSGRRRTQLTKLGTVSTFDWHPAGQEVVYVSRTTDGSFKVIDRKLASKQELVVFEGKGDTPPKVLCTTTGVLVAESAPTTVPRLLQLTITTVGYDGTMAGSFWTQVPLTKEQFDRTTWLALVDSTPVIASPGGIWSISTSSLLFDTAHTFLGSSGVTFSDGTFFGLMQDANGTFLGTKTKDGTVASITPPPTSSSVLPPFVRGASRTTDGKTITYELGIYGTSSTSGSQMSYETWQYTQGARKATLVAKGTTPSMFAYQFTGGSAPIAAGKQSGFTAATETGVMFRDSPVTIGSTVLEIAAPSETRTALALGQGWVQAKGIGRAKGKNGWIYGGYVKITHGSTTYAPFARVSASGNVKVYLDEKLSEAAATGLAKGDSVVALGTTADKRAIKILLPSGTTAFVAASAVTVSN